MISKTFMFSVLLSSTSQISKNDLNLIYFLNTEWSIIGKLNIIVSICIAIIKLNMIKQIFVWHKLLRIFNNLPQQKLPNYAVDVILSSLSTDVSGDNIDYMRQ